MRLLSALLMSAAAYAAAYTIDPAHSAATFGVRHMMVSTVRGQFSKVTGVIVFDPKNLADSKAEATIDVNTIDTREPKRDAHLKSPDFFDAARYPTMFFRSTKWWNDAGKLKVSGDLTIRGITKQVVFDVEGPSLDPKSSGATLIGGAATTKISRKEFGLAWNKLLETGGAVVGDEVSITLDIEAKKN
ncbi:MAG TPA: YceI family protein [Bryobacteraceae bacterium]|nr:YceI family protein [Bryobacteraceae bacterium]